MTGDTTVLDPKNARLAEIMRAVKADIAKSVVLYFAPVVAVARAFAAAINTETRDI
jgi:hypothetical protein